MAHKRKGQLTVSGEWARHLRPFSRRAFWKSERQAVKQHAREEDNAVVQVHQRRSGMQTP